jgi:hypothetical protein
VPFDSLCSLRVNSFLSKLLNKGIKVELIIHHSQELARVISFLATGG